MDEQLKEKFLLTERLYEGKIINLRRDIVLLPNGREATREVVEHPGAVAIVPVLSDGKILLVRQFRYPVEKILLEIPAGKLDAGEAPEACAARELEEETGYRAQRLERKSSIFTGPGFSDEVIHIFVAHELVKTAVHPDEDEFLEIYAYSPQEIRQMIRSGMVCDAKTITGLYLWQDAE
jgi:ADP-ribose pyrophosphatase